MVFTFKDNAWELFKQNPEMTFTELSVAMSEQHGEVIVLAQYLVLLGAKTYADKFNVPLAKIDQVLFARAAVVVADKAPEMVVKPCGSCGGGKVR